MMLKTVFAFAFTVQASLVQAALTGRTPPAEQPSPQISERSRESALLPLVQRATECVVRAVKADPRFGGTLRTGEINDLIVDALPRCHTALLRMIETHDRMYGRGSGEAFMLGPYFDVLPSALMQPAMMRPAAR
jgi:hypothetical protein